MTPTPTSGAADLASRLRTACTSVRSKSYPLADLIPLMQQAADALASAPAQAAEPSITLDFKMATDLLGMFCGEPVLVTLQRGDEHCHSGPGLYAWYSDMPEEGAGFLGVEPDYEATPSAPSAPAQPVAEPADTVVLNAAIRAIQQAIELIGAPTGVRMRAVRRVLRGAVIVAEDDGKVAPLPSTAYAALPEYGINTASHAHFRVLGFTADQMRAFADATHALRASHGQAPAGAAEEIDKALNVYAQAFAARVNGWTRQNGDDLPGARSALFAAIHAYAQASTRPIACSYGDNGYACCEGGPCQADVHNDKLAERQAPAAGMGHTDGGRNMFYEGRFDGESQREQQARLRWADGMRAAFERHTGNGWFDKDWRTETGLWSSAWHACLAAQPTTTAQSADSAQEDAARKQGGAT